MNLKKQISWPKIPVDNSQREIQRFCNDLLKNLEQNFRDVSTDIDDLASGTSEVAASIKLAAWPIGIPYIQFPDTPTPEELFGGTWENISSDYAGCFFRAEGGEAEDFEDESQPQNHAMRSHIHYSGLNFNPSNTFYIYGATTNEVPGSSTRQVAGAVSASTLQSLTSAAKDDGTGAPETATETRPKNYTIRVWQRTA